MSMLRTKLNNLFNRLFRVYKYIFYREYTWHKKQFGDGDVPHVNAIFGMSLSLVALMLFFIMVAFLLFDFKLNEFFIDKFKFIVVGLVILIFHYFLFLYKNKYKEILVEFSNETPKQRQLNGLFVLLYSIVPILGFIICSIILSLES